MQTTSKKLLIGALAMTAAGGLAAEESGPFTGNVSFTNDYRFRGITQTLENPAIQGGLDYASDTGFYAGIWGSNIDFGDGDEASIEIDYYAGYAGEAGSVSYDASVVYYSYPGSVDDLNYDYVELLLSGSYAFNDMVSAGLGYAYSPEFFGEIGDAHYFEANIDVALPQDFGLSFHVGRQTFSDVEGDYTDWSIGVSKSAYGLDFSLAYVDTNLDFDGADGSAIFTVGRSF